MERMGYGNQPYIVFLHKDIDRRHLHIVSTRVDAAGEKLAHAFERRRSNEIRRTLQNRRPTGTIAHREVAETRLPSGEHKDADGQHRSLCTFGVSVLHLWRV